MALVLGLGNPGPRYAATRHNVGWSVVERLVARWRALPLEECREYRAWRSEAEAADLLVPLTYMNASGEALAAWRDRHGLEPGRTLVVVDDVYLPLGRLRLRASGSSGGHNGLESLEAAFGGRDWSRLRIGVGAAESSAELRSHVLESFEDAERPVLQAAIERAADAVECWNREGLIEAMNRYNRPEEEVSES